MFRTIFIAFLLLSLNACNINNLFEPKHESIQNVLELEPKNDNKGYIDVALLLPLTGDYQDIGSNMLQASRLAFKELSATRIHLDAIDTGSNINNHEHLLNQLQSKKYDLILGPLLSFHTKVVYSYAFQHHIPVISFSNDVSLLNNEGLFLLGVIPNQITNKVVDYVASKGCEKIFVLLPHNRYGLFIENTLKDNAKDKYEIAEIAKYTSIPSEGVYEFDNALTIIKAAIIKHDSLSELPEIIAVLIPEGGEAAQIITHDLSHWAKEHKLKFKFLGSNQWHDEELISQKHLHGSWLATYPNIHLNRFEQRFYNEYGEKPFHISAIAYDSAALATVLSTKSNLKTGLMDPKGFIGASGVFRFKKDGSNERLLSVFEIHRGKLLEIYEASNKFNDIEDNTQ